MRAGPACPAWANGTPQRVQNGSVMNAVARKHAAQNRPGTSTAASQLRQLGGSSRSRSARPAFQAAPTKKPAAVALCADIHIRCIRDAERDRGVEVDLAGQFNLPG